MTPHQDRHLAEDGAERRLDALGEAAEAGRGEDRPGELADAAGDDHHERVDDVVLAQRRARRCRSGSSAQPASPARPAPKAKVVASTTPARTPRHALIARFWVTARMRRPALVRKRSQYIAATEAAASPMMKTRLYGSVRPDHHGHAAREPRRRAHVHVGRAEPEAQPLLDDQRGAPRQQQRLERPSVQEPDDAALEDQPDDRRHQERDGQRDEEVGVEVVRPRRPEPVLHDERRVGAERHELAVGHVDHAHQAEHDGEAERHQQQDRGERSALEEQSRRPGSGAPSARCSGSRARPPRARAPEAPSVRRETLQGRHRALRVEVAERPGGRDALRARRRGPAG